MGQICQSCGMPLSRDKEGGGTNAAGSKSSEYSSLCYQKGEFSQPDFSAADVQKFCIEKMTECKVPKVPKVPKVLAWLFTRRIPSLQRWAA